jgi:peroxiredoxin
MKLFSILLVSVLTCSAVSNSQHKHLIGTKAEEWTVSDWINSDPLQLSDLRGKVVLVRWWTGPDCPFCAASAMALNEWQAKYQKEGLIVVGFYHHKSGTPLKTEFVKDLVKQLEFKFPIAIDRNWATLEQWWLSKVPKANFTSISFLIDDKGRVQHIHSGGEYVKGDQDYSELKSEIENALRNITAE